MIVTELDERCVNLLRNLINRDDYLRIQEIAHNNNISKRSVYYDLCKINDLLELNNIDSVVVERNKGILLSDKQSEQISSLLEENKSSVVHVFSPMERIAVIVCSIINRDKNLFVEDFMSICGVSRNTIINDLKNTGKKLNEYNLELTYENGQGYIIKGDLIRKRAMFFLFFNDISKYYQNGDLPTYHMSEVRKSLVKLSRIEKELDTKYVEGTLYSLAVFIPKMEASAGNELKAFDIDDEMLMKRKEYELVNEEFPNLVNSEKIYLSLHLLGSRLQTNPTDDVLDEDDKEAYELAKDLVSEFSRIACVEFVNKEDLERNLFAHLKTSLYRYRYGIQLGNPLLDDIKVQYPELFDLTKQVVVALNQQIGVPINDSEIAYLTLHFGGAIRNKNVDEKKLRILIVCPNGISTGNMLKGEVTGLVPNAKVIDVKSVDSVSDMLDDYDVFISTIPLDINKSCLLVHPILTDEDRLLIMKKCMNNKMTDQVRVDTLLNLLQPYLKDDSSKAVKSLITNFFDGKESFGVSPIIKNTTGLGAYLNTNNVQYINRVTNWKDAIKLSGEVLVKDNIVHRKYLDAIIKSCEAYGPYMFISDGVVLAHAKTEDGVNHVGLSIGVFPEGVKFQKDKVAKIIFVLAAVDQVKHLKILKDLMNVFQQTDALTCLMQCFDEDGFIDNIKELLVIDS